MPSPGPKINAGLQQIMDISNRLGLFNQDPLNPVQGPQLTPNNDSTWMNFSNTPVRPYMPERSTKTSVQNPELPSITPMSSSGYMAPNLSPEDINNHISNITRQPEKKNNLNQIMGYGMGALSLIDHLIPEDKIKTPVVRPLESYNPNPYGTGSQAIAENGIKIKPSHKGLFTAKAKAHNEGVQEFAKQVLANKGNYNSATVKQANFARNFGGKAEFGMSFPGMTGVAGGKKIAEDGMELSDDSVENYNPDSTPPGDGDKIHFKDSKGLKAGDYSKQSVINLMKAAKALGVDPYESLGIAIQENSFGQVKTNTNSHGRRRGSTLGNVEDALDDKDQQVVDDYVSKGYDRDSVRLALALKRKNQYAKQLGFTDDALRLQGYNGYGTITPKQFGGATTAYGVDITNGVNLKKNPLYGKRILQLKQDLMNDKDFTSLQFKNGGTLREGQSYDLDHDTIKQLLANGYELDFE